jgi:hypothetical protein
MSWSEALEEAYASAPADEFTISTLELIHAAFVDGDGFPDSIRVALDERSWNLQLEAGAPLKAGQTVTFDPLAVEVQLPEQDDARLGEMQLSLDGVPRAYIDQIDSAVGVRSSALLIYREWIATHDPLTGAYSVSGPPDYVLGSMTVKLIEVDKLRISATATFMDLLNRAFPRRKFTREDFSGLF